jgi:hypothetical protein
MVMNKQIKNHHLLLKTNHSRGKAFSRIKGKTSFSVFLVEIKMKKKIKLRKNLIKIFSFKMMAKLKNLNG